jgi:hypothetical protein
MDEHKHDCDVHSIQIKNHEERLNKQDEILDKVRNRPPVWVTLVFGVLLAIMGFLAAQAGVLR